MDHPILIAVTSIGLLVTVCVLAYSARCRVTEARSFRRAKLHLEKYDSLGALGCLATAVSMWRFNVVNGSPASTGKDLSRLQEMVGCIDAAMSAVGSRPESEQIRATIASFVVLLQDRTNFKWDGRSMHRDAAHRWVRLTDKLHKDRARLIAAIEHVLDKPHDRRGTEHVDKGVAIGTENHS